MRPTSRITAAALATLIALAGITVQASPAIAADPAPAESPAATPALTPAPPATDPAPAASPAVAATDPALTPSPAVAAVMVATVQAVVAPVPTPALTASQVLAGKLRLAARIAITKLRARYVWGAVGPNAFDCSGFVRWVYVKAGISNRLGGGHSSSAMLFWGRLHHRTSRVNPQIGDVAVWGNGHHVGIYIGGGKVISALNPRKGVKITGVYALTIPFTTFIHTGR